MVVGVVSALAQQPSQQPAHEPVKVAPQDQPAPPIEQTERGDEAKTGPAPIEQFGLELLPAIKRIEDAIREHLPKNDEADRRKEDREVADLQAQRDMVYWARWMFWASAAGVFLTVVGLVMIGGTLYYTASAATSARDAANAANQTNAIVMHATRVELRAYLSVIPAGINELIGSQQAMGHVEIRNVGKLLARDVWVQVKMGIDDRHDQKTIPDERADVFWVADDPKVRNPSFGVDRAIHPGTQMRQGAAEKDTIAVADLLAQRHRYVYVWGVVYYDDGYQRRFTRFRHRYAIASHVSRDDWDQPARETREIIAADKARFHPFGNSAN
jgi:hypothetical protein